jgi:hypothetical protein
MPTAQTFVDALLAPDRALAGAADRKTFVPAILAATFASLLVAFVLVPRVDYERAFDEQLEKSPQGARQLSPHDREVALAQAQKLGGVVTYANALVWPTLRALSVAFCLFLAFRVAGGRPAFRSLVAVASWGSLPLALKDLLSLPALLRMHGIAARDAERALPSSLVALLPSGTDGRLAGLAQAVDFFSFLSLWLVALGAAHVSGVGRPRSFAVVFVLWGSYVLLTQVARPGLMGGGPG